MSFIVIVSWSSACPALNRKSISVLLLKMYSSFVDCQCDDCVFESVVYDFESARCIGTRFLECKVEFDRCAFVRKFTSTDVHDKVKRGLSVSAKANTRK